MWIPRSPEEVQKWDAATRREARFHGWLIAGLSWLGIVALLAGGWIAGGRAGVIAQNSVAAGSFWSRFPIFAIAGLPIAYWICRREGRRELESTLQMTICPKCDTAATANDGAACQCGGVFVLQRTVRWEDDEPDEGTAEAKNTK